MSNDVQPRVDDSSDDGEEGAPEVDGETDTTSGDRTPHDAEGTDDGNPGAVEVVSAVDDTDQTMATTNTDTDDDTTNDTDADATDTDADATDTSDTDATDTDDDTDADADATDTDADATDTSDTDADATDTSDTDDATDTSDTDDATDTSDATDTDADAPDTSDTDADDDATDTSDENEDATDDTDDDATDTSDEADTTDDAEDATSSDENEDATDDDDDDATDTSDEADTTDDAEDATSSDDSDTDTAGDADTTDEPSTDDSPSTDELAAELALLRSNYEALEQQLEAATKPAPERKHLRRPSRYWVSIACVVLGGLLLPLAVLVRWTSNTVLDTDSYVETVAPLAQDEDIQEALAFRVSVIILDAIDFQDLARDALPTRAGFLSAPIESGVRILVQDVVEELVSTEAFERLWEDVNRVGHENVVAILTGEGNDTLDTADGKVVVHLGPITKEVLNRLDEILGTNLENAIPEENLDGDFVLVESDDLANLQDEISLFDRLSWLIPILTIALLAASVILSRPRRLAFRRLGIAIAVPMAVSVLLYDWVRGQYIGALPDDTHNPDAAAAFFDITTRFVPRDMTVLLVLGLVILFLSWLFGPTGWAGRARAWWSTVVGNAGEASEGRDIGPAPRWVADNERTLLAFEVALGVVTLLAWSRPTGLVVLIVVVVVALLMAATSLLAEVGRRAESADEARSEAGAADGESTDSRQLNEASSDTAPAENAPT